MPRIENLGTEFFGLSLRNVLDTFKNASLDLKGVRLERIHAHPEQYRDVYGEELECYTVSFEPKNDRLSFSSLRAYISQPLKSFTF